MNRAAEMRRKAVLRRETRQRVSRRRPKWSRTRSTGLRPPNRLLTLLYQWVTSWRAQLRP